MSTEGECIVLEIGPRTDPIITRLKESYKGTGRLVLVDKRNWSRQIGDEVNRGLPYFLAKTENLPFPDSSATTIVSKDLFCAQGYLTSKPDYTMVREHVGDLQQIAKEWFRVSHQGARVIIIETATPVDKLLDDLQQVFSYAGFTPEKVLKREDIPSLFDVSAAEADKMLRDSARNSFALILRKE